MTEKMSKYKYLIKNHFKRKKSKDFLEENYYDSFLFEIFYFILIK